MGYFSLDISRFSLHLCLLIVDVELFKCADSIFYQTAKFSSVVSTNNLSHFSF
jgi:hypothetical protein